MQQEDDSTLVQRAQTGDEQALDRLYRRHLDAIYRYVYARVGNRAQAEDLTAEVFTRMVASLDDYDPERGAVRSWLFGITRHVLTDFWRRYYRVEKVPLRQFLDFDNTDEPEQPAGLEAWAQTLLAQLPDKYRRVLELRILENRTVVDTACENRMAGSTR